MKQIQIPLKGIERQTCTEPKMGSCSHLINLRKKNDQLIPLGVPTLCFTPQEKTRSLLFIHTHQFYTNYLTYDGSELFFEAQQIDTEDSFLYPNQSINTCRGILRAESIGNTVILFTQDKIYYLLYKEESYHWLGNKPSFPILHFYLNKNRSSNAYFSLDKINIEEPFNPLYPSDLSDSDHYRIFNTIIGGLHKSLSSAEDEGKIIGIRLLKYALKLYDGNYLLQSPPILLIPEAAILDYGRSPGYAALNSNGKVVSVGNCSIHIAGGDLHYNIHQLDLYPWRDIIESVDVFLSPHILPIESDPTSGSFSISNIYDEYALCHCHLSKTNEEIANQIAQEALFYKVASIPIKESYSQKEAIALPLKGKLTNLEQQEQLLGEYFDHMDCVAECSFVYNNKLHMANTTSHYFEGFSPQLFAVSQEKINNTSVVISTENATPDFTRFYIATYLHGTTGEVCVVTQQNAQNSSLNFRGFSPFLSYPDTRAYKMQLCGIDRVGSIYQAEVELRSESLNNLAYYIDPELKPLTFSCISSNSSSFIIPEALRTSEQNANKLRVSETGNPFYFPSAQTYTISNGTILGIAPLTVALSQGQYGEFPLYVFTSEGVWAMEVGKSEVIYTGQIPLNRDVCNNSRSITPLDRAIAYTTDRGIMLLVGDQTQLISEPLDEAIETLPPYMLTSNHPLYRTLTDTTPFLPYLKEAQLGYCYRENELIILNPNYPYHYRYALSNNLWSIATGDYRQLLSHYPHLYVIDKANRCFNLNQESEACSYIALVTRPISLGTTQRKRVRKLYWNTQSGNGELSLKLWGAYHANTPYGLLGSLKVTGPLAPSIQQQPIATPLHYYRMGIIGNVSSDFSIGSCSLEAELDKS